MKNKIIKKLNILMMNNNYKVKMEQMKKKQIQKEDLEMIINL